MPYPIHLTALNLVQIGFYRMVLAYRRMRGYITFHLHSAYNCLQYHVLEPNYSEALNNLGNSLRREGSISRAEFFLRYSVTHIRRPIARIFKVEIFNYLPSISLLSRSGIFLNCWETLYDLPDCQDLFDFPTLKIMTSDLKKK